MEILNSHNTIDLSLKSNSLPKEAYFYFPAEQEIIEINEKSMNKSVRRIFEGGVEYNDFEISNLNSPEVTNSLDELENIVPGYWKKWNVLRFLQATGYNITKSIGLMKEHSLWRKENIPIQLNNKILEILNLGFIYVHGRDNRFRPNIIIDPSIFISKQNNYSIEEWLTAVFYLLNYLLETAILPGQIENWNIICDVKNISIFGISKDFLKLLPGLQSNFRCRLYVMHILNVSSLISGFWSMIKGFLDQTTERKIRFHKTGGASENEIFTKINRNQLEKKFGGLCENVVKFFPPTYPSTEYQTEFEKVDFVTEQEYIEKLKTNKNLKESPYIEKCHSETSVYEDAASLNSIDIYSKKKVKNSGSLVETIYEDLNTKNEKFGNEDEFNFVFSGEEVQIASTGHDNLKFHNDLPMKSRGINNYQNLQEDNSNENNTDVSNIKKNENEKKHFINEFINENQNFTSDQKLEIVEKKSIDIELNNGLKESKDGFFKSNQETKFEGNPDKVYCCRGGKTNCKIF